MQSTSLLRCHTLQATLSVTQLTPQEILGMLGTRQWWGFDRLSPPGVRVWPAKLIKIWHPEMLHAYIARVIINNFYLCMMMSSCALDYIVYWDTCNISQRFCCILKVIAMQIMFILPSIHVTRCLQWLLLRKFGMLQIIAKSIFGLILAWQ